MWKRLPTWAKVVIGLVVLAVIVSAASGGGSSSSSNKSNSSSSSSNGATSSSASGCGTKATSDCTPHVGPGHTVRVDAIDWRVLSASTAQTLGDPSGLGAKANGTFVVVKIKAHSTKTDSATLTGNSIKLEIGGLKYDEDNSGSTAVIGAGGKPFLLETVGPDSTVMGTVVFDVPPSKLSGKVEVRFNELGFGDTHGYIALKPLQ